MIKTSEGISVLIYSLVFVSLSATEVHSCAVNAERSIKKADSVDPWMNWQSMVAAWCVSSLNNQAGFINSHHKAMQRKQDIDVKHW